jgi:glutamine synthetase adenylyltransferase
MHNRLITLSKLLTIIDERYSYSHWNEYSEKELMDSANDVRIKFQDLFDDNIKVIEWTIDDIKYIWKENNSPENRLRLLKKRGYEYINDAIAHLEESINLTSDESKSIMYIVFNHTNCQVTNETIKEAIEVYLNN